MDNENTSPFKIPRYLGWFFLAGIALALLLSDYLLRQRNPFERMGPAGGVPVAVLYFESDPATPEGIRIAAGLDSLFAPALARAGRDSVVPPDSVHAGRLAQGLPASGKISPAEALGLAGRIGARRILFGAVSVGAHGVLADARLIAVSSGHELAVAWDTLGPGADPGLLADSLAARMSRRP